MAMARATPEEKKQQLDGVTSYQRAHASEATKALRELQRAAVSGENIFAALMSAARVCSLGQMTHALFEVGGRYRRNI